MQMGDLEAENVPSVCDEMVSEVNKQNWGLKYHYLI